MTVFELVANRQFGNKHVLTKLIEHHTGIFYKEIVLHYEDVISESDASAIVSDYWKYEKEKIPLEYIVGHVDFFGNSFAIDKRAMIPRPETEYMIEGVLEEIQNPKSKIQNGALSVLDLGCGCGVLGISVTIIQNSKFKIQNTCKVVSLQSWDLSSDAVELTKINMKRFQDRLDGIELGTCVSEGLTELNNRPNLLRQWKENELIIVCNYPYIPDDTFDQNADDCARTREPRSAFVGGKDGLDLYRVLFGEIVKFGLTKSILFLEMMTYQLEILNAEFSIEHGGNRNFQIIKTFHFNIIIVKAEYKERIKNSQF